MPTKPQTIADAVQIFQATTFPGSLSPQTAWLGFYRALMWYEPVNVVGITSLPHIIDANALRPASPKKVPKKVNAWQKRALAFEKYLAQAFGCQPPQVAGHVDRLMQLPNYPQGMQRQNSLGIAFAGVVKFVLERLGNSAISYELEVDGTQAFPGVTIHGRSSKPLIDILARKQQRPVAIISTKWSLRLDRINDMTNECPAYKQAASWTGLSLRYYAATNEFGPTRLHRVLRDPCIDGLVHVHKPAVVNVCGLDGRLSNMLDLADLVSITHKW